MAVDLDQFLVIDIESTCWEGRPPTGQRSEIIEIGLCTVDLKTLSRLEKRSILVRPVVSTISPFCTELTSLSPDMFDDALTLADAAKVLMDEYDSQRRLWGSWGDYDRKQFETCCRDLHAPYPFGSTHLNIKALFAAAHGLSKQLGLGSAYKRLGLEFEGRHHRGHDDAWNIGGILCTLLASVRDGGMRSMRGLS